MEIVICCMECQANDGIPNFDFYAIEQIPDNGIIECTCNRGHRTLTVIQEDRFAILSNMALRAIAKGFYRDAIASFASSLERAYEFFLRAFCEKRNIGRDCFEKSWNLVSNQSERQLGAFITAYLVETGKPPKLLSRNQTELRNKVVHKGKFPDREDAINFGQEVAGCISPILDILSSNAYSDTNLKLTFARLEDGYAKATQAGIRASTYSFWTLFNLSPQNNIVDIRAALLEYDKWGDPVDWATKYHSKPFP